MTSTMDDDRSKPVTGYPPPPPLPPGGGGGGGYPPAQTSNTGTAYPYVAPPQPSYYAPNPYPAQPYAHAPWRTNFLRRMFFAAIVTFLIIGLISFITWLVLRPQLPKFRVDSATVYPFNISNLQITANWDLGFTIRNPNKKMNIIYDRMDASVYFRDEFLSVTAIAPFYQGKKTETTLRVRFAAVSTYVDDRALMAMARDQSRGMVNFNVRILARVRFRAGGWRIRRRLLRISCEDVTIGFSSNNGTGTLLGGPKSCKVFM